MDKIDGYKTYIAAAVSLLWGVIAVIINLTGIEIPGIENPPDLNQAIQFIVAGLGLIGWRSAKKKEQASLDSSVSLQARKN